MKYYFKKSLLFFLLLVFGLSVHAQKDNLKVSPNLGVTTPILDGGIGFHLGINPAYTLSPRFSVEGQVSYLYTKINGSFLSGNEGRSNSINTLVGGRLYLNSEEKRNRFYLNLLFGGNYNKEEINDVKLDGAFDFGFSGGGFFEINKFLIGVSYDTPQNFILKVGYVF